MNFFRIDFEAGYQNWEKVNPIDLFGAPTQKVESNPKNHVVKNLKKESKGIDYIVLWLDCDREGENICFEVLSVISKNIKNRNNVFRAKFSSLTPHDILQVDSD